MRVDIIAAGLLLTAALLSCSGGGPEGPEPSPIAEADEPVTPTTVPPPAATPPASSFPPGYDPNDTMFRLFSRAGHPAEFTLAALQRVRDVNDTSQVPVIIELMRFLQPGFMQNEAANTLTALTGQRFRGEISGWAEWTEWHGRHAAEYPPPDRYVSWKINLLSLIDPRFSTLLATAESTTRIDLTEAVWGGVGIDGIPPLESAPTLPASAADYLTGADRVFGVSINGEHRAYPLRVVNAHEMANDVLGGEPISLAY